MLAYSSATYSTANPLPIWSAARVPFRIDGPADTLQRPRLRVDGRLDALQRFIEQGVVRLVGIDQRPRMLRLHAGNHAALSQPVQRRHADPSRWNRTAHRNV